MAKKKPPTDDTEASEASDTTAAKPRKSASKEILLEARQRYQKCVEFERENRQKYRDDMRFVHVPGEQWDDLTKKERGLDRPMYEFNHTRVTVKNVINEMRSNRPTAKFYATEDADKPIAEARQGIARFYCNKSDFDSVRDFAAEHQCGGGFGAWEIETKYLSEDSFDQEIAISAIHDPLCLYADYACQDPLKRDANFWFKHSMMTREAYEARWPEKDVVEFEADELTEFTHLDEDDRVWVAAYWKKVPVKRRLCQYADGSVIDKDKGEAPVDPATGEPVPLVRERTFMGHKIVQYILSGDAILEGPNDWAGSEFPFVIVYGDYTVVDGKVVWCGVARYMKDAQRAHNWAMTSVYEDIASSPSNQYWATAKQAEGQAAHWNSAIAKNIPFLLYNADSMAPGPPQKSQGKTIPVALIQAAQMSTDEMKACSGIFDASIGAQSNETSGRAIANRAAQGRISTFNFQDNMLKAVRRTFEILNDLIPKVIDTPRTFRILGEDGAEKYIQVNARDVNGNIVNDLTKGQFDIAISAGPNFATQRLEAADVYMGLAQGNPQIMGAAGDLIFKSLDYPYSDAIAERLRLTLPPPIQQALNKDKPLPPEAQAALMQAEQMMQAVQAQGQLVQQAAEEAKQEKAGADKAKSDVQIAIERLKVQEADLKVAVADFRVLVAQTEAKQAQQAAAQGNENEKQQLGAQLDTALAQITQQAAQLFSQYAEQLAQMHGQALATAQPQVVVANQPRRKVARTRRVNGELHTEIDELPMVAGAN